MRAFGLVVALVLLVWGLYRLFMEEKERRDGNAARARRQGAAPKPSTSPASGQPVHDGGSAPKPPAASPKQSAAPEPAKMLPSMLTEHDADEDITIITLAPPPEVVAALNALKVAASDGGARSPPKPPWVYPGV